MLADDHPLVRTGIRTILADEEDVTIVGEAVDGREAQQRSLSLRPDILLLDLSMPGPPASETVIYLREHCPQVKVLMLTAYDDEAYVRGLVAAGVMGYILKDEMPETIVRALHAVMRGDTWFSLPVVRKLARKGTLNGSQSAAIELTERERRILQQMVWGLTDREIGEALYLSERTVRYSLRRVYDKLGVDSRVEAAAQAVQLGLAKAQDPESQGGSS